MAADCALHQASMYQYQPLTHPLEFTNISHGNKLQQFRASSVRNPSFSRFNFSEKSSFFSCLPTSDCSKINKDQSTDILQCRDNFCDLAWCCCYGNTNSASEV